MKSTFKADLYKEKQLHPLLNDYYKNLKNYTYQRVINLKQQKQGVDLVFKHKQKNTCYYIDEKAQLDYVNHSLPTFAFEILYYSKNQVKQGWLFDQDKITDFYALITAISTDPKNNFKACEIYFVNRKKLVALLQNHKLNQKALVNIAQKKPNSSKICIPQLNPNTQGYLYASKSNKAEKPLNLILKLQWLQQTKVAKKWV